MKNVGLERTDRVVVENIQALTFLKLWDII